MRNIIKWLEDHVLSDFWCNSSRIMNQYHFVQSIARQVNGPEKLSRRMVDFNIQLSSDRRTLLIIPLFFSNKIICYFFIYYLCKFSWARIAMTSKTQESKGLNLLLPELGIQL